jgi:Xaa-Pro aminopeptidase
MSDLPRQRQKDQEFQARQRQLDVWLERHALEGVLLWRRQNFSWVTCGRQNHIANNSPVGVAAILATREQMLCLTNNIEAPRILAEELTSTGIEVLSYPWSDQAAARTFLEQVIAGRRVAEDTDEPGLGLPLPRLPGDFCELRWSLSPWEIARYRHGGRRSAVAMEAAARQLKPGMTEHEAAGLLDHHLHASGCLPLVTLIAADDRIERFRHPIPTRQPIRRHVMLVTCAESAGLISCLTRFVHFGAVDTDLKRKHQAVANIDAAVNLATKPGRTFGEIFSKLQQAYAREGFADEWQLHHQGGSTGYATRETLARPGDSTTVRESQAFAWNPSITGTKSEDTVLVTSDGVEVLTAHSSDWPSIAGHAAEGRVLRRADILVM